jgi:hypothetical protein
MITLSMQMTKSSLFKANNMDTQMTSIIGTSSLNFFVRASKPVATFFRRAGSQVAKRVSQNDRLFMWGVKRSNEIHRYKKACRAWHQRTPGQITAWRKRTSTQITEEFADRRLVLMGRYDAWMLTHKRAKRFMRQIGLNNHHYSSTTSRRDPKPR